MSGISKLEGCVEIKSDAATFHNVFGGKHTHHTAKASPGKISSCDPHDGHEFGQVGALINWTYVHEGKEQKAKVKVEEIDDEKNSVILRIVEGHLLEEYKSFVIGIEGRDKSGGGGSTVYWTFEYEKVSEDVADPHSLLQFELHLTVDIDAHLIQNPPA